MVWGGQLPHYVTVTARYDDEGNELTPKVEFTCPWLYGQCHFWPDCGHETFGEGHLAEHGPGHEVVHHDRCWMQDWFDNDGHSYDGEDSDDRGDFGLPAGMNRSGAITASFQQDYIEWAFV